MKMNIIHPIVERLLIYDPSTRDDDDLLYMKVCKSLVDQSVLSLPFERVITERKKLGVPNFSSVRRARRKIQEHNPLLRASKKAEDGRYEEFKEIMDYVSTE